MDKQKQRIEGLQMRYIQELEAQNEKLRMLLQIMETKLAMTRHQAS